MRTLSVVGTVLALLSVLAIWVNRLALETDTWVATSDELLADDEIRAALAATLTDRLYSSVDVAEQLRTVLPPAAESLAGPAAAGLREFSERRANIFLQRPRVVNLWSRANRVSHEQFVRIVKGESAAIQTQGGDVVLVLRPLLANLAENVGIGNVAAKLPANAGTIVIMKSDQLDAIQTLFRILDLLATWLWAVALACWAIAVYLSPGRRIKTIRGIAFGLVFVGLLVLAIVRIAENFVVNDLVKVPSNKPAAGNVIDIVTETLRTTAWTLAAIGILMVIGAWLSGEGVRATRFRRWAAPGLRDHPEFVWGAFAFIVLLVLLWGPIRATRNLVGIVVLVGLAALGLWAFRRLAIAEFPAEPWTGFKLPGWRPSGGSNPGHDKVEQLERLAALEKEGALTKKEFEAEKAELLGGSP